MGDTGQARIYNDRGLDYYKKGQIPQAIDALNTAIKYDPQYAKAFYNRGTIHSDTKLLMILTEL